MSSLEVNVIVWESMCFLFAGDVCVCNSVYEQHSPSPTIHSVN